MPSQSGASYRAYNYPGNPGSAAWDTITLTGPVSYQAELYGMQLHQNRFYSENTPGMPGSWITKSIIPHSVGVHHHGRVPLLLAAAVGLGLAYIILKK